jgi:hypothetical protein
MAFPGVAMPICHNLIEAMSVGTIPIIQASYAKLFQIPFTHLKNAIIFENETDLNIRLKEAFSLSSSDLDSIHREVYGYYNENFSPEAVTANILKNKGINYILADKASVRELMLTT